MIGRTIKTLALLFVCSNLLAQIPLHSWRDHYSFDSGKTLCYANNKVYCATDIGIFTYKPSTGEIDKLTKTNGLSDVCVSTMEFVKENDMLIIGYENGNIDLVYANQIINIPDILNKPIAGSKSINNILYHNNLLYLSTGFGIVVLNAHKQEIKETYYIGPQGSKIEVYSLKVFNNRFYAATQNGLMSANVDDPFLYNYQNWNTEQYSTSNNTITKLSTSTERLFFVEQQPNEEQGTLWSFNGNSYSQIMVSPNSITDLHIGHNKIIVSTSNCIKILNLNGNLVETISQYDYHPSIKPSATILIDPETFAIADLSVGLAYGTSQSIQVKRPNGIIKNTAFAMAANSKYTIVTAGAYNSTFTNSWTAYHVNINDGNLWSHFSDYTIHDAVSITFNPRKESEYYVGSWGYGIFQYEGKNLVNHFSPENSSLLNNINNKCRISGICFDSKQNLWVSNPSTAKPISVRKPDGTWAAFNYAVQINTDKVAKLYCSPNNHLWLLMPRDAIFVLDPSNNIESQDDDKFKRFKPVGSDGSTYNFEYNTLTFDQNGYLWLGTSQGVLVCYNPNNIIDKTVPFHRIKIPDIVDGFAVYLLENENITTITTDGGNRKWIGTSKSGVFLYSADCTEQIYHFDTRNSPLPSNSILDIAVHPKTGEVFFGTDNGLVSFRGESTASSATFSNVYAYPNPVRPDFNGDISIVGLVNNTIVKITDISGNLVYETKSIGGSATWNGKNLSGHRVATGVYLVLLSSNDGSQKAVTKILFVN